MDWSRPRLNDSEKRTELFGHFQRFLSSRHCRDLLLIAAGGFAVAVLVAGVAVLKVVGVLLFKSVDFSSTEVIGLIGGALTVVGWAYQAANLRFGVADIFAAEIATLCRVAVVGDLIAICVARYISGKPPPSITESRGYTTVFDSNAKDLEVLDSNVVGFVTQFYMYVKQMQNSLEQATEPQGHPAAPYEYGAASHEAHEEPHRHRSLHAIYNAFLAFESARQAIEVLVDDRKTREQYVLTILQAELPAYFLLYHEYRKVENDVRSKRILPRLPKYRVLIKSIADATSLDEASRALAERVRELWDECVCGEEIRFPEKFVTPAIEPGMARVDRKTYLWGHADRQPPPEAR